MKLVPQKARMLLDCCEESMIDFPEKAHYRPEEVAEYFGLSLSIIYRWIAEGKVEAIKPAGGRVIRISCDEIEKMKIPAID